jgi:hypothetical protein
MSISAPVPLDVIVTSLTQRVRGLVLDLLPNGVREGREWRIGSIAGEPGRSMAVHLEGGKAGVWSDFSSGQTGDALDLVAAVLYGGDKKQAVRWARGWLGLEGGVDPAELAALRKRAEIAARKQREQAALEAEQNRGNALRIWIGADEATKGQILDTPVDAYLRGRGVDLRALGRRPGCLRFHPDLFNKESGRRWPAMIALVAGPDGQPCAVHRTWLAVHPDGRVTKAPLKEPKMTLGAWRGGTIRLWRGASKKPWADMPDGELLDATEGIEDGFSVALACPELRVAALINVANLATVALPAQCGGISWWRQNDPPDSQAARALDRGIAAQLAAGRRVLLADVPASVKDVNDLLRIGAQQPTEEGVA